MRRTIIINGEAMGMGAIRLRNLAAAGALATTVVGAVPSIPTAEQIAAALTNAD